MSAPLASFDSREQKCGWKILGTKIRRKILGGPKRKFGIFL